MPTPVKKTQVSARTALVTILAVVAFLGISIIESQKRDKEEAVISAVRPAPAKVVPPHVPTRAEKAAAAAAVKAAQKKREQTRIAYAKFMETRFLDEGWNVDVRASGPQHTVLTFKYSLASRALGHQTIGELGDLLSAQGFTEFVMTNGYESWSWKP